MTGPSECCVRGFNWGGTPEGQETKLGETPTYLSGANKDIAIMIIHDAFGFTFTNTRLLADHYAKEVDAAVYLPDL
jgi:hypothetical protein